jgi:hypothetical protein
MHLPSGLLLLLAVAGIHGADLATNFTVTPASECKFPFVYNRIHYYGCTTAGNPTGDNRPWCIVDKSKTLGAIKQDWLFCDQTSVAAVAALKTDDNAKCVGPGWQMTPGTPNERVFGCTKRENEQEFSCVVGGAKVMCKNLTPTFKEKGGVMATIAGLTSGGSSGSGKNVSTIIGASIGGALLVGLVAGLIIVRRKGSDAKGNAQSGTNGAGGQWDYKHSGGGMDAAADYGGMSGTGAGLLDGAPQGKIYAVISTYTPTLGDELEIQPGDKVSVLVEYDDGWCQGVNHTRGGLKGVFPKHCVDLAT